MNNRQINKLYHKATSIICLPWMHFIEEGLQLKLYDKKKDWKLWNRKLNCLIKQYRHKSCTL